LIQQVRDGETTNGKLVNEDAMNWAFVVRAGVTTHQEFPTGD
jgi:hypothetical protein